MPAFGWAELKANVCFAVSILQALALLALALAISSLASLGFASFSFASFSFVVFLCRLLFP